MGPEARSPTPPRRFNVSCAVSPNLPYSHNRQQFAMATAEFTPMAYHDQLQHSSGVKDAA